MRFLSAVLIVFSLGASPGTSAADVQMMESRQLVPNSYIVTFKPSESSLIVPPSKPADAAPRVRPPFGEHSTGQSREELGRALNLNGRVARIFESINAAHVRMDAPEAERLRTDPRVLRVEPDSVWRVLQTTRINPGWGLDRLDQAAPPLNGTYVYRATGAGQTIYILDTGMSLNVRQVAAEFGSRASVFWDVNGGNGEDCADHGTAVASAAAGNTHGVAKGATLVIVKMTAGCSGDSYQSTWLTAWNWLTVNAPRGTIVNKSSAPRYDGLVCGFGIVEPAIETAMRAAYNAGIIMVVGAGNDGCDTGNFTPTRSSDSFVVGATQNSRLTFGQDARAIAPDWVSRYGSNISAFAPGRDVQVLDYLGYSTLKSGTSYAAPYVAGLFAAACQFHAPFCSRIANAGDAYAGLRAFGAMGTVVEPNGSPLPGSTPSRFIWRRTW